MIDQRNESLEAEQHLIACCLYDETATPKLLELPEDWFAINAHKLVIRAIRSLVTDSLNCDMFSIADRLTQQNQINNAGGMEYLVNLAESMASVDHWDSYKRALFDYYKKRQLTSIVNNVGIQVSEGARVDHVVQYLQEQVIELLTDHHSGGFRQVGSFLDEVITELEWREANKGQMLGQTTGYRDLDFTLDGFQDGKVYVIAGRPGSGKTAFALSLADRLTENQKPWFYFSLEMTGKSLSKRMMLSRAKVSNSEFRRGKIEGDGLNRIGSAIGAIQDRSLHVDQTPALSLSQLRSRLKASAVKHGRIGGIMIDHIGLIKKDARKADTEAMNMIADGLLELAKEFDCPLVELCQLNRGVEGRPDKRPMISDLKQSGKIEENADVVMLLYRDDYYDRDASPITEVNVAKNRDGAVDTHYFKHDLSIGHYEDLSDYEPPKEEPKGRRGKL